MRTILATLLLAATLSQISVASAASLNVECPGTRFTYNIGWCKKPTNSFAGYYVYISGDGQRTWTVLNAYESELAGKAAAQENCQLKR